MDRPAICAAVCVYAFSATALADHDNAQSILGAWTRLEANLYVLQPAKTVRALETAPAGELGENLTKQAAGFLEDQLALILIKDGKIVFEGYANGADKTSRLRAYSIVKSLTALAVGEALCAGNIKSLDERAGAISQVLGDTAYGKSSIRNLLKMASGAQSPANPWLGIHDVDEFIKVSRQEIPMTALIQKYGTMEEEKDGTRHVYNGLNSEALGLVVAASTGMPLQNWFEASVWQKAGGESTFGWLKDRTGQGFGELGSFGTTRDYARIGLYVLDRLMAKSDDPCMSDYLREAARTQIAQVRPKLPGYGFALHVDATGNPWMRGHGGQSIGMSSKTGALLVANGYAQGRGYYDYLFSLWEAFDEWAAKR